jgi:putative membrane protein
MPRMPGLDAGTQMALNRTRLAHERTMMAWIRTATSLISFGFTIYKFFDLQNQQARTAGLIGPRAFAFGMIGTGLVALLLAAYQHRQSLQMLRQTYHSDLPYSTAALVGVLVAILGFVALAAVVFQQ